MTENDLKRLVLRIAYRNGWLVYHHPMSTVRGSQGRGYPDLTLARNGDVLWMELKQAKGIVTNDQKAWAHHLGAFAYTIRPADIESGFVEGLLR